MHRRIKNPLRYPGGKATLADYVAIVLEENLLAGCTIHEPFGGSAAVSLDLLSRGFVSRAVIIERDPLIFSFWAMVFSDPARLCSDIETVPVTMRTWDILDSLRSVEYPTDANLSQLALAGLFFNRTNYSGIVGAGPIGGRAQTSAYALDCRFNKATLISAINEIAKLTSRVSVVFDDAQLYLRRHQKMLQGGSHFIYLDPPYYEHGRKYYRYHYESDHHAALANYIMRRSFPWLLSYDDHPAIRELYRRINKYHIYMDYSARTSRRVKELLISNLTIPPQLAISADQAPLRDGS